MLDGEGTNQALTENADAVQQMDAADQALDATVDAALGNEAPAEQTSAPAESAAPAAKAPAAQPRDTQGRFTQQPPAESPPDGQAPTPAPDGQGEPTAEAEGEPAPGAEPSDETQPEVDYPEATYRYDGKDVAIPGSLVGENGAFIPTEHWRDEVLPLISLGRSAREGAIRQQLRQHGHETQRWKTSIDAALASRDEVFNAISAMVDAELRGDTERGFGKWSENLLQNWEILRSKALVKAKDVELAEERRQRESFEQDRERATREPQMQEAVGQYLTHFAQIEKLDAEAQKVLLERLNAPRFRQQIFTQATEDDPAAGIQRGQLVVNYGVIEDEVKFFARTRGGQPSAQRVQQLQQENARRTGQASKAPPVATAKRGQAPAVAKLPDLTGKSTQEVDELLWDRGGYKNLTSG